jgi:hypothetical protein
MGVAEPLTLAAPNGQAYIQPVACGVPAMAYRSPKDLANRMAGRSLHVRRRYLARDAGRPDRVHDEAVEECGLKRTKKPAISG